MKYTPAPWDCSTQRGTIGHCFCAQVWRPDGLELAHITPTEDEEEASANAKLISAAPDMFEALKVLLEYVEQNDIDLLERIGEAGMVDDGRKALEKAGLSWH
jgi:antitoxin component HigA of HigAB toxin-antitoxin module